MLLYIDEYQTIKHDRSKSLVETDWTNASSKLIDKSHKRRFDNIACYVERYKPQHVLANMEQLVYKGSANVQKWAEQMIYTKFTASSVQKIAFIKSNDLITRVLMEQVLAEIAMKNVRTEVFDSIEEAKKWLLEDIAVQ